MVVWFVTNKYAFQRKNVNMANKTAAQTAKVKSGYSQVIRCNQNVSDLFIPTTPLVRALFPHIIVEYF